MLNSSAYSKQYILVNPIFNNGIFVEADIVDADIKKWQGILEKSWQIIDQKAGAFY